MKSWTNLSSPILAVSNCAFAVHTPATLELSFWGGEASHGELHCLQV